MFLNRNWGNISVVVTEKAYLDFNDHPKTKLSTIFTIEAFKVNKK